MDTVGQITHRLACLVGGPVPDRDLMPRFDQTTQAGNGRQAGAAPVDCHGLSFPYLNFSLAVTMAIIAVTDTILARIRGQSVIMIP